MKKSYIICPYCKDEITISGMTMHVKVKHPDKFEEFKSKFEELKKTAVVKDSGTKAPPSGKEPPKIDEPPADPKPPEPPERKDESKGIGKEIGKQAGDDKPPEGKSFLREFDEWWDSDKL